MDEGSDRTSVNQDQEQRETLELFEQLHPRHQLDRLIFLLEMPKEHQPPPSLNITQRENHILDYYAGIPNGLQKLAHALRHLIENQGDSIQKDSMPNGHQPLSSLSIFQSYAEILYNELQKLVEALRSWLQSIIDSMRRKRRQVPEELIDNIKDEQSIQYLMAFEQAWNRLYHEQQEILRKIYQEGCTRKDVAAKLDIPLPTLRRQEEEAKKKLTRYLRAVGILVEVEHAVKFKSLILKHAPVPSLTLIVELTIEKDFDSFSSKDEDLILNAIKDLLNSPTPIRFVGKQRGSTKLRIELTLEQAEQFLWLYKRGVLDEWKVTNAKVIGDAAAAAIVEQKAEAKVYDVFMCHNSEDKSEVKRIALRLRSDGILPWLDEWELQPGLPWQKELEEQIETIGSAAVFVGNSGICPWQDMELNAFIRQFVHRQCPVIPVILRRCKKIPQLPPFLNGMTWVNFRKRTPDPYDQLVWGVTGKKVASA